MREFQPLHVLLVEDSPIMVMVASISSLLHATGAPMRIRNAVTEREAIEALSSDAPQLVILDLKLRHGNGFGVLRALAKRAARPVTIVVTNYALPKYRELLLVIGADYFIDKALMHETLPNVLQSILSKLADGPVLLQDADLGPDPSAGGPTQKA